MIGRLNGNIDLSQVNLLNVKRIEIVEGPLSVNYGSDALGGTINIITKKSNDILPAFESYYETIGKYNNSIVLNQKYQNQNITYFLVENILMDGLKMMVYIFASNGVCRH